MNPTEVQIDHWVDEVNAVIIGLDNIIAFFGFTTPMMLSCPMSLIHFPIHFHLFPFISVVHFHSLLSILLLHAFSGLRLLCPCLRTPLHASASVHLMCLSSRPFRTHPCVIDSLFQWFTLATYLMQSSIHYHM